ncbi:MAG: hypothetical protein ACU0BF_03795, partial [Paracoccaceae bacterium]
PIEGRPLIPAHATTTPPPETGAHEAAVWDGAAWSVVADHRGAVYWTADGTRHRIDVLGETPPDGAALSPSDLPPYPTHEAAVSAMRAWMQGVLDNFTAGVPAQVVASWPSKAAAARAIIAGGATDAQAALIGTEAALTGEDVADLAARIAAKADVYERIVAAAEGLRRATLTALERAETSQARADVLAHARAKAGGMMEELGLSRPS